MHELSFPAAITLPITDTLASIPTRRAAESPNKPMYALRAGDGWTDVTAREFNDLVRSVARGLVARGIEVGQPVAILSPTRYEWTVLDFALWTAGAFAVPIYDSSSAEQIEWILQDSDAVAVITDSALAADRVAGAALTSPPPIWVIDDGLLDALVAEGAEVPDEVLTERSAAVTPQDPATIVYTSGTTGRPKGCVITHENLMYVARTLVMGTQPVVTTPGARTVLFLPLAHVLGRGAQVYSAEGGMQVAHCPNVKLLAR